MKRKILFALTASVFIAAAVIMYSVVNHGDEGAPSFNKAPAANVYASAESGNNKAAEKRNISSLKGRFAIKPEPQPESVKAKKERAEEKEKSRGEEEDKFDHPDKFAEFDRLIKTPRGASAPQYPLNYKMIELKKAIQRRFGVSLNSFGRNYPRVQSTALPWIERGPGNVAGRTRGMIVDPADPSGNTWFAAAVSGGVWKTTDEGKTWTDLTPGLPTLATTVLAMAPSDNNIIYLGTGEGFYNGDAINGNGIFKSTDHGNTWFQLTSTASSLKFQNINRIIVSPSDANTLLACTNVGYNSFGLSFSSGILKSTDGGTSWSELYLSNKRVQQIMANPKNFNTIFAAVNGTGIIKSTDGGTTWDTTTGITTTGRVEFAIAPSDTARMYAAAEAATGSSLFISEDAGNTWTLVNKKGGINTDWLGGQGWYGNVLAVNPYHEDSLIVGGIDLYKIAMEPGIDTVAELTGAAYNTKSFLGFVNWGGAILGGGGGEGKDFLGSVGVTDTDKVSVEIRFGPGISQFAHRFQRDASTGKYEYKDYVPVPFEVWDVNHNRQLMVSFRDWDGSGVFKLLPYDNTNLQREYIFISSVPYDSTTPSPIISTENGMEYKNIYAVWPILADGATWDPYNLPVSKVSINFTNYFAKIYNSAKITEWYTGANHPYIHADQHNIIIMPSDTSTGSYRVLVANDGGSALSNDDGVNWTQFTGYRTSQFYGADKNPNADQYIGGMQDNGTWYSNENPTADSAYKEALGGDGFDVDWKYDNAQMMMGSVYNDYFYRTTDGGMSWSQATGGLTDAGSNAPFITSLAKTNQDPDLLFTTGQSGIWRSDNFGETWTLTAMPDSEYSDLYTPVRISLVNPQIVWTGEYLDNTDVLRVSTDGGITFQYTSPNTIGNEYYLSGFETDPVHDSTAYALFSESQAPKILKTTDLGKTWKDLSGFGNGKVSTNGFPDVAVFCLLVMPTRPDTIWAGTEIGLFQSTDGGGSWEIADNGLPAVAIWRLTIVGDEVIAATHGRGIWTVKLPWLAGYTLPAVTKSPRLNFLAQNPDGSVNISVSLRSAYDSSTVNLNGTGILRMGLNNAAADSILKFPIASAGTDSVQVLSYKSGREYKSSIAALDVISTRSAQDTYANNFDKPTNDFSGSGFKIDTVTGFSGGAIQSVHPYSNNSDYTYQLFVPITVASSNADLYYDDIALVEPGEKGADYGNPYFYDYVVVEGSSDGYSWLPLAPGYDCRSDSIWLKAWNSNSAGDSTMFMHHDINLLNTFKAGQKIFIRFRLYSDAYTNGWGWAIDNLSIQPKVTGIADRKSLVPDKFDLSQNYPNPFNPTTTINFQLPKRERVTLVIYNMLGQKVKTLADDFRDAGYYKIVWDGTNNFNESAASGVYLYKITAGSYVKAKKMILLK